MDMGICGFMFSGYAHKEDCELFANYVLPQIPTYSFPQEQGRIPDSTSLTPHRG